MTQADIVPIGGMTEVTHGGLREPNQILLEAQKRAEALIDVVNQTNSFQLIGKKKHLQIEAWVILGQFYNCTARCTETVPVTIDGVEGFHAKAQLVHDPSGQILSTAEAYCMRDEERWNTRPVYEWKDNEKVQVGSERVPLFQLASMAQTRSMARVIAAKFRWVVVLAGYAPTAAEEMTGNEQEVQEGTQKKEKLKPKPAAAPKFSFGKHKGQTVTDPDVPLDYLQWMADKTAETIKEINADAKHRRAPFKAQEQLFLAALDAEIAYRKAQTEKQPATTPETPQNPAKTSPGEVQTGKPMVSSRKPFSDASWAEFINLWEEDWFDLYAVTKEAFSVTSGHDLPQEKRHAFYDEMNAAINLTPKK